MINKIINRYNKFKIHPLTKGMPAMALFRYLKFNIFHSLKNDPKVYNWINGLRFYAQKGDAGIVPNIYFKLFDYEESMFIINRIHGHDVFVDVGANVGHFTLLAASNKARVYSFEPIPSIYEKLLKNINLNNLSESINCYNYGVGDKEDVLFFSSDKDVMNSVELSQKENSILVNVKSLDNVLKDIDPLMLKIDVEGYEYFVLKGAEKTLSKTSLKYILIELNKSSGKFGISDDEIHDIILKNGFRPVKYDVLNDVLVDLKTYNKKVFNTLYLRD